jgi:hypothetical protein
MADNKHHNAPSAEIVRYDDPLLVSERVAVAAFLAGYSGGTRISYTTDLRIFAGWCHDHDLNLLNVASNADPRTTMRYDRARRSLDRHATYLVSTFIAGATRPG